MEFHWMDMLINVALLAMMVIVAVGIFQIKSLFAVVMFFGIYSLLSAVFFVHLDAVDVAFTEAAVGAGISTILMLSALALTTKEVKSKKRHNLIPSLILCLGTGSLLWMAVSDFPEYGKADNPIHQHVADAYLKGHIPGSPIKDIDIPNVVTPVLATYRGYDTMGETVVVFTAALAVMMLLGYESRRVRKQEGNYNPGKSVSLEHQTILKIGAKICIPMILIFALYVQFHGDYSPGGGFQAGVIFAAGILLYALIYGLDAARYVVMQEYRVLRILTAVGVLLYVGTGVVCMLNGGNFLDYNWLFGDPANMTEYELVHAQHIGILLVELGVGITVASVMISIIFSFVARGIRLDLRSRGGQR